ncbi:phosphotransferase [Streptomyces sp. SP18BB07]|uniref:phosphotransferase n=1 Tax=Streptomyces sp. SP18BB07 TaxID=3002522 RepID=UPI002E75FDC0|nr:phosphotransferase [Streptomyces sp. SP18BB07]MEE1763186.1 phosphotransferase [Streptomyces sp. SP18BB07]
MLHTPPLGPLLEQYAAGSVLGCEPVDEGLLNRGYRLRTTRGRYFLKHHFDPETADPAAILRQHRATQRLADLGVPVAPPLTGRDGRTVAVVAGHAYALHPWIEGRHRHGGQLTPGQCARLGALLGVVHASLERVMPTPEPGASAREPGASVKEWGAPLPKRLIPAQRRAGQTRRPPGDAGAGGAESADPVRTFALIDDLLDRVRRHRPADPFDALARHRLLERRQLLARHADRRPPRGGSVGWVHGDFHPFNVLYRDDVPDVPAAILDWDRLGVQPRAEEAVRAAVIFFVRPVGALDLPKVRSYARAYRRSAGAAPAELAAAVHRVWWERLNDFWMLRWRYERGDRRADPQFPAASALVVWWTREYDAVRAAFVE